MCVCVYNFVHGCVCVRVCVCVCVCGGVGGALHCDIGHDNKARGMQSGLIERRGAIEEETETENNPRKYILTITGREGG